MIRSKTSVILAAIIISISILLMSRADSQTKPKTLDYYSIIPEKKAKSLLVLEGEEVNVTLLYQNQTLYAGADDMMKVLGISGSYDTEKGTYIINGKEFSKRKVYEVKNPSTKEITVFLPVDELLKFIGIRYTLSNLGEYPTVRIQTSSFALPTPTQVPQQTGIAVPGTTDVTGTPTPSPQQVFSQKCSKCHAVNKVFESAHSTADWSRIVPQMQAKDPQWITGEEASVILQYLSGGGR
ncbi:MAG: hypothetical protein ABRQ38_02905 [Candidatus Eremiobacterota bacterium]